ncbi:ABC-type bacteriocin/lantibiotic exporter with double-glycine peptidase domain [Azospirillum agricola]|uniref:cysteine peptidase family C39 domain-containing protein n=1 Tax=Azospirillum agricola TaxID=1720247 RepID=UPI001AE91E33|nr:cysteine peptidase family C39 domain-containing protein [Azospirillum agricola]MBP2230007.1 ABC-type bacteriocin/lantibiotic exporter with double-glycine peptidase domain [Azospirillum agricola]
MIRPWNAPRRPRPAATPDLRQGETAECGLAALAILLAHHGRPVPLETLRVEAGSTRLGSTARTLLQLARHHGMEARAFRKEPEALATLGFPLIVHSRFIHFLVVEGMTAREVRVNDPGCGPRRIPWEEFADDFTGIAITVRPAAPSAAPARRPFRPGDWPTALSRRLFPQRGGVLAILAASLLSGVATTAACLAAGGLANGHPAAAAILSGTAAVTVAAGWARDRWMARFGNRLADGTAAAVLARLLRLPAPWFARRSAGQIAATVVGGAAIQTHAGAALALVEAPLLLVPAAAALAVDPVAGAGPVASAALGLAALGVVHARRGGLVARAGRGNLTPVLPDADTIHALDAHKTGGRDAELFGQFAGRHALQLATAQEAAAAHATLAALRVGLAAAGLALAVGMGALGVAEGRLTPGHAVALAALAMALHGPLTRLDRRLPGREALKAALHRLADVEATAPEDAGSALAPPFPPGEKNGVRERHGGAHPDGAGSVSSHPETVRDASPSPPLSPRGGERDGAWRSGIARPAGRLVLENAGFRPSPLLPPILAGIDLIAEPGRRIGIAGPSGSGKSVLAKLACGLLVPEPGRVLLDGHPVDAMARRFPGAVALVDRSSPVEPGTIADNLRFGDRTLGDAALQGALDLVALTADLEPRGGLSLMLARGGAELSGGQRRRLALARALLRRPVLLVLDEALDALEPDLDRAIRDRLCARGCTTLIVSRRPESLLGCDRVIELGASAPTAGATER